MGIITTFLLTAAVVAKATNSSCPKYCTCTSEADDNISAICTRLSPEDQKFDKNLLHLSISSEGNDGTSLTLTDYIFEKLGLTELESLKITNTSLTDVTDKTFIGLSSLYDINLSYNQLFLVHPKTFANISSLRRLKLSGNPMQLTQMLHPSQSYLLLSPSLNEIDLSNCQLAELSSKTFTELKNLIFVNLSLNYLKFIPKDLFDNLQYLEELDLSNNLLTRLQKDTFIRNTELSSLNLRKNPIEILDRLNITSLDELDMSYCKLRILMKETLEGVPHVTILNLSNNQIAVISDDTFTMLRELRKLDLSYNKLIGPLPADLFKNNNDLKELSLSGNRELGDFVDETGFSQHHSAIEKLELVECGLTRLTAGQLKGMNNLNELNVSNNAIRDLDDSTFSSLNHLNILDLSNNRLLSLSVHLFVGNSELVTLKVSGNPIKSLSHQTFRNTPILKSLDASSCELDHLWNYEQDANVLINLVHLDISKNKLRNLHKRDFSNMKQLEIVDVRDNPLECLTSTVNVITFFDYQRIDLCCSTGTQLGNMESEYKNVRWNALLEDICSTRGRNNKNHSDNVLKEALVQTKTMITQDQTSLTKVNEIVVQAGDSMTIPTWLPILTVIIILIVAIYIVIYLISEITHRRREFMPSYTRTGLGSHVCLRDASGFPLYYKLYEECSVSTQSMKTKNYVFNFATLHSILKNKNTIYKILKINEAHV